MSPKFRFRLNCIDYYQCSSSSLDPQLASPSPSTEIKAYEDATVPIIRIFGATETGQKVCAHIHGAFPYLYIPYEGSVKPQDDVNTYIKQLTTSIDRALATSYRRNTFNGPQTSYVAFISLAKGIPFFGFHVGYQPFLKIYLRNPAHMTRFADLLTQGGILAKELQPYESHMQYLAQWMCDYNLYGCAFIDCEQVKFRTPLPTASQDAQFNQESVPSKWILDSTLYPKQSHCELEVDVQVHHILNREQITERKIHQDFKERFFKPQEDFKFVPSMAGLWKDEAMRRNKRLAKQNSTDATRTTTPTPTPTTISFPPEALVTMSADSRVGRGNWVHEEEYFNEIRSIIEKESSSRHLSFQSFSDRNKDSDLDQIPTAFESVKEFYPENVSSTLDLLELNPDLFQSLSPSPSLCPCTPPFSSQPINSSPPLDFSEQDLMETYLFPDDGESDSQEATPPQHATLKKRKRSPAKPEYIQDADMYMSLSQQDRTSLPNTQTSLDSSWRVTKRRALGLEDDKASDLKAAKTQVKSLDEHELLWTICTPFTPSTKEFQLRELPPDPQTVMSSIIENGGPSCIKQDTFYGNELDIPSLPQLLLNREHKVQGKTVPYLPEFDATGTSLASRGINPPVLVNRRELDAAYEFRKKKCTLKTWEFAELPPTWEEVNDWIMSTKTSTRVKNKQDHQRIVPDQIEGSTMIPRTKGTSQEATTSITHETQYMSMLSVEIHVNTRKNRNPDPVEDEISCIFWSIKTTESDSHEEPSFYDGVVILDGGKGEETGLLLSKWRQDLHIDCEASEVEVIRTFTDIVLQLDPDILVGYEVHNGSWGYLIDRARVQFDIDLAVEVSRVKSNSLNSNRRETDQWGLTKTSTIRITGRHTINVWRAARGEQNYLQYTLENVAFQLLNERVPHYSFELLTQWYESGKPYAMCKVIKHMLRKVHLNMRILDKMDVVARTSEQARLLGVDFFSVISRGSQFKVESLMFRIAKPENYILVSPSRKQVGHQNALECLPLVMEPRSDFYPSPLLVLDFQSLYPSIMIAYNYCYSTCLGRVVDWRGTNKLGFTDVKREEGLLELLKDYINISPNGLIFVRPEIRRSLLAKMLTEILETRVMVKSGMKQDKEDQILQRLLNNRQLALKLIANVTYGYTSASFSGRMPCAEIADSIVQTARETLERAIAMIHSVARWDAEVVYGDTDSLFIYLKNRTREEAFAVGKEMAEMITKASPRPMKLKFEKVYHPCVLLAKKRYVGFKYESVDQKIPEFDAKGIETVRRDGTPAKQKIEEKALKILFRTHDLSQVKRYFQAQCAKIIAGQVSIQDFLFAREVKLGSYSDRGTAPAGAVIATRKMLQDHRKEPQYRERIPYLVVAGAPGARLIDRCVDPDVLLYDDQAELDADYYISKNIIPPLERIFHLMGANIKSWYDEVTKVRRLRSVKQPMKGVVSGGVRGQRTLETYLYAKACCFCGENVDQKKIDSFKGKQQWKSKQEGQQHQLTCDSCQKDSSKAAFSVRMELQGLESRVSTIDEICRSCEGIAFTDSVSCDSRDCSVFYSRVRCNSKLDRLRDKAQVLVELDN